MLHVYAIAEPAAAPPPVVAGAAGEPLSCVPCQELVGVAGEVGQAPTVASEATLWAHEAVVEALMERGAVLPARFGTVVADEAALAAALERRQAELRAALDRVRGAVELGVRARWADDREVVTGRPATGRAYLAGRLEVRRRAASLAEAVHTPLAGLARDSRRRVAAAPRPWLTAAYLVEREAVDAFRARAAELAAARDDLTLACTGPWPPYSFVPEEA